MGIFKDFATSAAGDLTIGAFQGIDDAAQKDVVVNATASNDALRKENEAFALTETAFKNRQEISNILAANPEAFGLSAQEGLGINQVADRFANFMFLQNRSIFENKDMDKVKLNVAKFMAANPGEGFDIYDPYISGEDRFDREKNLHQARLSEITKMPKADKLLMKIKEAEADVATPEAITNELTKVTALNAKGYGILNTYPTTEAGMKNMHFVMTNIITANAKKEFPNDAVARAEFINQRLYDNNIDPTDGIMYTNNMNYKIMSDVISAQGGVIANQMLELTNKIAAAPNEESRQQLNDQLNQLVLEQHKTMDTYTKTAGTLMAGMDRDQVFPVEQTGEMPIPLAADGYVPTINTEGDLVVDFANGNRQTLDLELLIQSPDAIKLLPIQAQNYINTIKDRFFVDGQMIKPTREMFEDGPAGDKAFNDFLNIHKILGIQEEMDLAEAGGIGEIKSPPKSNLKDADVNQLKKKVTGDEIQIEEIPPANTIVPPKKPDQPDKPKEKSLQDKIQEDFGSPNVGTSGEGGDIEIKGGLKDEDKKPQKDIFSPDIDAAMADFKLDTVNKNYIINQWSKKYQGENKLSDRIRANTDLTFRSFDIPEEAQLQIGQVANVFAGQNNFSEDNIMEMLGAIGFFESKYKTKIQGDGGPARSYWQVEPATAKDILKQNTQAKNPILGQKFEQLFKAKYADQIGNKTALQYFASLDEKQLSNLLETDGLFAATMAGFKVVTTFDPFNSKGA